MKRKLLVEGLDELKAKKKHLECEASGLVKSADAFSVRAEPTRNIDKVRQMVAKFNSYRMSSNRKLEEAAKLDTEIDMKLRN